MCGLGFCHCDSDGTLTCVLQSGILPELFTLDFFIVQDSLVM